MVKLGGIWCDRIGICSLGFTTLFILLSGVRADDQAASGFPQPQIPCNPRAYVCYRTSTQLDIDGRLDEPTWQHADWTDPFVDIEGESHPAPRFLTRAKMLWDDTYFYAAVEMEEPQVWATLTERDAVIYHDNDIEIFIDPDGDTHEYYELEVNALGTEWDLLLVKPYRDGGPAVNAWDIQGLQTAVHVEGTLNQPDDLDVGWTIEMAIPWRVLKECAHRPAPPEPADQWRVNFSRVEWRSESVDGRYQKRRDPETGKPFPEDNWVWSPQGLIAMHYPEMWGIVQFSSTIAGEGTAGLAPDSDAAAAWLLRRIYYRERGWLAERGEYMSEISALTQDLQPVPGFDWPPQVAITPTTFEVILMASRGGYELHITQDGRVWRLVRAEGSRKR